MTPDGILAALEQVKKGEIVIENVKTDEIIERKLWESTIVILPTTLRGASGSPVRIITVL